MLPDIDLNAPCENSHPLQTVTPLMDGNKPLPNHETQQQGSNNQGAVTFNVCSILLLSFVSFFIMCPFQSLFECLNFVYLC